MMEVIKKIELYKTKFERLTFEEVDGLLYSFLEEKYDSIVTSFTDPVDEIEIDVKKFLDVMNHYPIEPLEIMDAKHGRNSRFVYELYLTCRTHDEDYLYLRFY